MSPVTTKSSQAADDTHSHPHGTSTSKGRSIAKRFAAAAKARTTAKEDPPVTQQQPADAAELEDAEEVVVEGKAYFVRDDTPPRNFFLIMQPILVRYGFFLTSWVVPERWAKVSSPQRGTHTPSIAFRHLPPNSARFSYATEGVVFISAQLSSDAVSAP